MTLTEPRWHKLNLFAKRRTTSLDPTLLQNSPDSGYGSTDERIPKSRISKLRNSLTLDTKYVPSTPAKYAAIAAPRNPLGYILPKARSASSPLNNFASCSSRLKKTQGHLRKGDSKCDESKMKRMPLTPDRFVPIREKNQKAAERFRTNKPVSSLSVQERLARNIFTSVDSLSWTSSAQYGHFHRSLLSMRHERIENSNNTTIISSRFSDSLTSRRALPFGTSPAEGESSDAVRPGRNIAMSLHPGFKSSEIEKKRYHKSIACALDIDRTCKILNCSPRLARAVPRICSCIGRHTVLCGKPSCCVIKDISAIPEKDVVPSTAFRVLDAPGLRDDFYCSSLAYSPVCRTLAVGLAGTIYTWSESTGSVIMNGSTVSDSWLTSIAFSSASGQKCILASGRTDGSLILQSTCDSLPRFDIQHPCAITSLSWRPIHTLRPSRNPLNPGVTVQTEDLLVGDETGTLYYYIVEWPMGWEVSRDTWPGSLSLVATMKIHRQQLCGLSWSNDGFLFATGGNDNLCCLFAVDEILRPDHTAGLHSRASENRKRLDQHFHHPSTASQCNTSYKNSFFVGNSIYTTRHFQPGSERYRWIHRAAVKAIAFHPWNRGLVATGGGSNDKCIHFFDTDSGTPLATISVSAQVTSLTWSQTGREVAATFGYAYPEHPYKIAVFRWPSCAQIAAIPWEGELRALYAIPIPYQRSPPMGKASPRNSDYCIVVASSDLTLKFYRVWPNTSQSALERAQWIRNTRNFEDPECLEGEDSTIR